MLRNMMQKVISQCRCLKVKNRKLEQLVEALSDDNRWFAAQHYSRAVTEDEAISYYLAHGGPEGFAERMQKHQKEHPWYVAHQKVA